jgi:hypothetical protein
VIGWFGFVVVALAAFRLTRVVTTDKISLPLRDRLYDFAWNDDDPVAIPGTHPTAYSPRARAPWRTWLWTLLTCGWCLGFWVAAATYSAWRWWDTEAVRAVITVFAIAGAQGLLGSIPGED